MPSYEASPELRWKPLAVDAVAAWSELSVAVARADGHRETFTPDDLREELRSPGFDPLHHSVGCWATDKLVGAATVWVRRQPRFDGLGEVAIEMMVHPDYREIGIEGTLLDRSEVLGETAVSTLTPGLDYMVLALDYSQQNWMADVFASRQYVLARLFNVMSWSCRALHLPDLASRVEPVKVRRVVAGDSEGIREAHNDAFRDHWGSGPASPDRWRRTILARSTRLDFSRVAVDQDGTVLSYALVGQYAPNELHVLLLGTRAQHARRGLGRAVLSEVLRAAEADLSIERVIIEVDSESGSRAGKFYTSLGFETFLVQSMYQKFAEAPPAVIRSDRQPPAAQ